MLLSVAVSMKITVVFDRVKSFVFNLSVRAFAFTSISVMGIVFPEIYCTVMLEILYLLGYITN